MCPISTVAYYPVGECFGVESQVFMIAQGREYRVGQPGVEAYKKNMFALLGKPGYEAEKQKLEARLK